MSLNIKLGYSDQDSYVTASWANNYFTKRRNVTEWTNLTATSDKEAVLTQAARDLNIFSYEGAKYYESQALEFPRDDHEVVTGYCATYQTESTATLTDSISFKNTNLKSDTYNKIPNNYWQYGSCHLTDDNEIDVIATSNATTAVIHLESGFTASLTTSTAFKVFAPVDTNIMQAQCEQALFILKNPNIETIQNYKLLGAEDVRIGDVSVSFKPGSSTKISISPMSRKLLSRWVRASFRIGRG